MPVKESANTAQFLSCLESVPAGAHHQSPEAAGISAWVSVAFIVLILFLPALMAANASSHSTLSCIAFHLHSFLAAFSASKQSMAEAWHEGLPVLHPSALWLRRERRQTRQRRAMAPSAGAGAAL